MNKLEGIKEGDTVEVSVRGVFQRLDGDGDLWLTWDGGKMQSVLLTSELASPHFSIKRIEPELKVGDRVRYTDGTRESEVVARPRADKFGNLEVAVWRESYGYEAVRVAHLERAS